MANWPASLPQAMLLRGYERGTAENIIRSSVDAGPDKTRRRGTTNSYPVKGVYLMDESQLSDFLDFYNDTTKSGSLSFTWPGEDGSGSETARFQGPQRWRRLGTEWEVTISLEILP